MFVVARYWGLHLSPRRHDESGCSVWCAAQEHHIRADDFSDEVLASLAEFRNAESQSRDASSSSSLRRSWVLGTGTMG